MRSGYIQPEFNSRYPEPSVEVREKLYLSWLESRKTENRDMYCPVCGFRIAVIPKNQTTIQNAKCKKCKFEGPLSPAYFRRMKGNRRRDVFPEERTFIR